VVGPQRGFFKKPSTHNLEVEEISRLRQFLKEAGPLGNPQKRTKSGEWLWSSTIQVAHIYHDLGGKRPEDELTVKPHDLLDSNII